MVIIGYLITNTHDKWFVNELSVINILNEPELICLDTDNTKYCSLTLTVLFAHS